MAAQIRFILDQVVVRFSIIDYTFLYDASLDHANRLILSFDLLKLEIRET